MAILLISHDLGVIAQLCDRTAVMRAGRLVETAPTATTLSRAREQYTRELVAAVPKISTAAA
jgi:ABC-type dipeptide/oligopeptide/nickel transport system ATPase component